MILPRALDGTPIGRVFGAPVTFRWRELFPLVEVLDFGALFWLFGRGHPERTRRERLKLAALATPLVAGVEWCHNLAHTAAAQAVGKPADEFKVLFGTPRLVYRELNDSSVTPLQHMARAAGGPLLNLLLLPILTVLRGLAPRGSKRYEVLNASWWMNVLVLGAGLLPIPGIDGGALLKWELVRRGRTVAQADETVRQVNGGLAAGLGLGAVVAALKRKGGLAMPLALFAGVALAVWRGWMREK